MRNSPGCVCCNCSPTTGTVCICSCTDPIPTTATIEDTEGTWTLTRDVSGTWRKAVTTPDADVFMAEGSGGSQNCSSGSLGHYEYAYILSSVCNGDPSVWTWKLTVITPTFGCYGPPVNPPGVFGCCYDQANSPLGNSIFTGGWSSTSATIPFTCDVSGGLTFTLPTSIPFCGLPFIGGGGTLTVVF